MNAPTRECAHKKFGICPSCERPLTHNLRFESREPVVKPEKTR